jgi:hypothetical protein
MPPEARLTHFDYNWHGTPQNRPQTTAKIPHCYLYLPINHGWHRQKQTPYCVHTRDTEFTKTDYTTDMVLADLRTYSMEQSPS